MPRSYGTTNAGPYTTAPAVGAAGDTYWNNTSKTLYVSDGTVWRVATPGALPAGGAAGQALGKFTTADFDVGWLTYSGQLMSTYNGSLDTQLTPGIYVRTSVAGDPIATSNSVIVEVLAGQDSPQQWRLQRMHGATAATYGQIFQRTSSAGSGAWSPWINVGAGAFPILVAYGSDTGPFAIGATTFGSATTWGTAGGLQQTFTPLANHVYRIRVSVVQVFGGATGNGIYMQLTRDAGTALGTIFGLQAYLTGVLRTFGPSVEYIGTLSNPGTATTIGIRGWSSQASSGAVAAETGNPVFMTVEDLGLLGGSAAPSAAIPAGGSLGQALVKNSGSDYDMVWGGAAPLGLIGFSAVTDGANRTATGFATATDQGTISGITIVAGRRYRIRVVWPGISATFSAGNGAVQAAISRSGSQHGDTFGGRSGVSGFAQSPVIAEWTGSYTAGTYNFSWRVWCGASVTGVVTSGTIITTVEDLGALV